MGEYLRGGFVSPSGREPADDRSVYDLRRTREEAADLRSAYTDLEEGDRLEAIANGETRLLKPTEIPALVRAGVITRAEARAMLGMAAAEPPQPTKPTREWVGIREAWRRSSARVDERRERKNRGAG